MVRTATLIAACFFSTVATAQSIYPPSLSKIKPYEFGQAILLFIPEKATKFINWSYRVDTGQVVWATDGYEELTNPLGNTVARRLGLLRIHVAGEKSFVLKKTRYELGWSVLYFTERPARFGVESITLKPGVDEPCFGTLYEGCTFDPTQSLKTAGISTQTVCQRRYGGDEYVGYQLSYLNKKTTLARWITSGGSGGQSSWFELVFSESSDKLCNPFPQSNRSRGSVTVDQPAEAKTSLPNRKIPETHQDSDTRCYSAETAHPTQEQLQAARKGMIMAQQLFMRIENVRSLRGVEVPTNFFIDPEGWSTIPYDSKKKLIASLSVGKEALYGCGERSVFIFDGYTGKELGRMGVFGPSVSE